MKKGIITFAFLLLGIHFLSSQQTKYPEIGAQVFIEPGQSQQEIDHWFKIMAENDFSVCRIRLFESYCKNDKGQWDFTLFDQAFNAAGKHGIKVFVTLFPAVSADNIGGFKFPTDENHLKRISVYIEKVVNHYKDHQAFYAWVLQNEPGSAGIKPDTEFTRKKFAEWKANQPDPEYTIDYMISNFDAERFHRDYETWYLSWLFDEVRKHDPLGYTHANSHAIFDILSEYDFSAWRSFLSSHGASMHPGFHYGYFEREQYALAMSANSGIVKAGAGDQPFWVTELQGGNNIYSSFYPLCPTRNEIAQWLWTNIGSGAEGIIFWCLNPRASAGEAGEWALLDFQDEPTDRFLMASKIAKAIRDNAALFEMAYTAESDITLMYNQESMYIHQRKVDNFSGPVPAREKGAVIKSALGYYEALQDIGISCKWSEMDDYNWKSDDHSGEIIILPHVLSIPSRHWQHLDDFVMTGGRIIASGLTGYFDEYEHCVMKTGFPLQYLFGGNISEFKIDEEYFHLPLNYTDTGIDGHFWKGYISSAIGEVISKDKNGIYGVRNNYGRGEVLWIPSPLGLAAWHHDKTSLVSLLKYELKMEVDNSLLSFKSSEPGIILKLLHTGDKHLVILINPGDHPSFLEFNDTDLKIERVIFNSVNFQQEEYDFKQLNLASGQVLVLLAE